MAPITKAHKRESRPQQTKREYTISAATMTAQELDEQLVGWAFEQDEHGDWRGTHQDGRRTALKFVLSDAQTAALVGEYVCSRWPSCEHSTPQVCARDWRAERAARRYGYVKRAA